MNKRRLRILGAASVAAASSSVFPPVLRPLNDYLIPDLNIIAGGFLMIAVMSALAVPIGAYWLTRAQSIVSRRDLLISAAVFALIHWVPTRAFPVFALVSTRTIPQDVRMLYMADLGSVVFFFVPGAITGLLALRFIRHTYKRSQRRGDHGRFLSILGAASVAASSYFIVYYGVWPLSSWIDQVLGENLLYLGDIVKMSAVSVLAVPAGVYWLIRTRAGTTGRDVLASVAIFALVQWFPFLILAAESLLSEHADNVTDPILLVVYLGGAVVPGAVAGLAAFQFMPARAATH